MSALEDTNIRSCYRYIPNFVTEEEELYLLRKIEESPSQKWKNVTKRRLQIWGGEIAPNNTLISQPLPSFLVDYPNVIERLSATGVFEHSAHKEPNHVIVNEYRPGEGIMPHEDGPAYHPVVATISLGSHTIFHYLRYKPETETEGSTSVTEKAEGMGKDGNHGRVIDQQPVLSLLLEPRSVIITTGTLYKEHLHFIDEITEDWIEVEDIGGASEVGNPPNSNKLLEETDSDKLQKRVRIDNWDLLSEETKEAVVASEGRLARSTRVSLTCRDVEKVKKIGVFGRR